MTARVDPQEPRIPNAQALYGCLATAPPIKWDATPETMAGLRASIVPIRADTPLRGVLAEDFPDDCLNLPISGGWGCSQADAIVFVRSKFTSGRPPADLVSMQHLIARKIVVEELVIC